MAINNPGVNVYDEGALILAGAPSINFVGAGVTASNVAGVATATIPGGGGGSGALTLIEDWLAPGGTNSKTFSAIPGTYKDLVLIARVMSSTGGWTDNLRLTINGRGNGYNSSMMEDRYAATANENGEITLALGKIGTSGNPNYSMGEIDFMGYALETSAIRGYSGRMTYNNGGGAATLITSQQVCGFIKFAEPAITTMLIALGAGNFVANSRLTLYGRS